MDKTPQQEMAEKMSKMIAVKGGRPSHITRAERMLLRKGSKRDLSDQMRSRIGRDANSGIGAQIGAVRRLKHKGVRGGRKRR